MNDEKSKKEIDLFLQEMSGFADNCQTELSKFIQEENKSNSQYSRLHKQVKKTLLESSTHGYSPKKNVNYPNSTFAENRPIRRPKVYQSAVTKRTNNSNELIQPVAYPSYNYSLHPSPCPQAYRFFKSSAHDQRFKDIEDQVDEFQQYPSDQIAKQLDGKIDSVLHIGSFNVNEFRWRKMEISNTAF